MLKDKARQALEDGKTLYTPTWYITMPTESGHIYATCGQDNCCENDWENFEEFWDFHGDDDKLKIL